MAAFTGLSWRRGYYVIPKIIFGSPPDGMNAKFAWLPRTIPKKTMKLLWRLVTGGNQKYGLPEPDHDILESHPLANSTLLNLLRHGDIQPRPDVARFEGSTVHFVDGRSEAYDVVIAATGYKISFPFLDTSFVDFSEGDVPLYLRVFHPDHPTLYFIGLLQPQGCIWPLADTQAQLVANRIAGNYHLPADIRQRIQRDLEKHRRMYQQVARHALEVEYHEYQKRLFREVPKNAPEWTGIPARKSAAAPVGAD